MLYEVITGFLVGILITQHINLQLALAHRSFRENPLIKCLVGIGIKQESLV